MKKYVICLWVIIAIFLSISFADWKNYTPDIKQLYISKNRSVPDIQSLVKTKSIKKALSSLKKYCKENYLWEKKFLLTFDDGPHSDITPKVLEILDENNVNAVFFVLWKNILKNPSLIKEITKQGHILWNHSFTHRSFKNLSKNETKQEIKSTNSLINSTLWYNYPIELFRPPYWKVNDHLDKILEQKDLVNCFWNFDSLDWQKEDLGVEKEKIKDNIKEQLSKEMQNWRIILFHDVEKITPELMEFLIKSLKEKWYKSVF